MATIQVKEYELLPFKRSGLEERSIGHNQAEALKRVDKTLGARALQWEYVSGHSKCTSDGHFKMHHLK